MASIILGVVAFIIVTASTIIFYKARASQVPDVVAQDRPTLDSTFHEFKNEIADLAKDNGSILTSDINYEIISKNRKLINDSIADAYHGVPAARDVVIGLARNFAERRFRDKAEIMEMINFEDYEFLDSYWIWELLLYRLSKIHGQYVIPYLEETYHITELKEKPKYKEVNGEQVQNGTFHIREFDSTMLREIFMLEVIPRMSAEGELFTYYEVIDILATYYQSRLIGLELLDTLEQQKFDGMNMGASGSIRYMIDGKLDTPYRVTNSLWLQIDAKWVLFSFFDFKTVEKMRKIISQLVSYGSTPPMTEKSPSKVTDGVDKSRRVAIRPGAGETWFYSQRNFVLTVLDMKSLLDKPYAKNWELPATLIKFLIEAEETLPFTGKQNTGKTTAMKAAFEFIEDKNIRVLEMSFELQLRELYPWKNTFTVKPTDYISSANLQDLLKKTDSWVSGVGEVAEDIVAARMIQFCIVGSAFTLFSHHGKDDEGLIDGLTNSLVSSGEYKDHDIALRTILEVIHHNIHYDFTEKKERILAYISQIIKEDTLQPYPEIESLLEKARMILYGCKDPDLQAERLSEVFLAYTMLTREFYSRTTDRAHYKSRRILEYDTKAGMYITKEWYTPDVMERMLHNLDDIKREQFIQFYVDNWVDKKYLQKAEVRRDVWNG
ncbi:MAG: hypothetical protein IJE43_19065 [Alphaproteobacteria bacterium]|nr:hypothetical protein [Alphaproteobacteria bacterium]